MKLAVAACSAPVTASALLAGGAPDQVELGARPHAEVSHKDLRALCTGKSHLQLTGGKDEMRQLLYQMQSASGMKLALTPDHHVKFLSKADPNNQAAQLLTRVAQAPGSTLLQACSEGKAPQQLPGVASVYPSKIHKICSTEGYAQGMAMLGDGLAQAASMNQARQLPLSSWPCVKSAAKHVVQSAAQKAFPLQWTQGMSHAPTRPRLLSGGDLPQPGSIFDAKEC